MNVIISGIVGGIMGSVLTALLVSKLMIGTSRFDTIQCRRLEVFGTGLNPVVVVSGDGVEALRYDLGTRSGGLSVDAHKPGVFIGMHGNGGIVELFGRKRGALAVKLNASSIYGGYVGVIGSDGSWARLAIDEYGGRVGISNKDQDSRVELGIGADGIGAYGMSHGGYVTVHDRKSGVSLKTDEHGGLVEVRGGGEGQAVMGINEYGNGAVSTWDKNGYRQ